MKSPTYYYLHSNNLLFGLIGLVNDLDTITCPSVSSLGAIAMEFGMDIIVTYGTFSIIYILVTTDVVGDNWCGRFGLWPFRSVAVSVCGRSGLWPFRFVAVPVCGCFGLWPFRFVVVSVCGRFGLWPFRLWPFRFVAVMTCYRFNCITVTALLAISLTIYHKWNKKCCITRPMTPLVVPCMDHQLNGANTFGQQYL